MGLSWIDTHCHLDAPEFDRDRQAVMDRAQSAGVSTLVVPAVMPSTSPQVLAPSSSPTDSPSASPATSPQALSPSASP